MWSHNNANSAFFDDGGGMSKQLRARLDQLNEGELDHIVSVCTIGRAIGMIRLMQCQAGLFKESNPAELQFSAEDISRAINLYRTLTRVGPKLAEPVIPAQYAHLKGSSGPGTEVQGTDTHGRLLSNAKKLSSRIGTESDLVSHSQHSHISQKHPALDKREGEILEAIEVVRDEVRAVHNSLQNEVTGLRNVMVNVCT
ncbi:hypothetical protein UCRNP2_2857 [Neofusicoccum parvum UCRNP2]|uniref:Uncharacterized protein n=1 Tax=Botryosphaeria parva (strain UCR-NP2) TaxID=1287680 RepID=R1GWB7_BOTPV|nr:hypothetical protein UCRNP2_2857 [Neofusicoccum parvum UCRNP2]